MHSRKCRKTEQLGTAPRLDVAVNLVWRWDADLLPAAAGPKRTAAPLRFVSGRAYTALLMQLISRLAMRPKLFIW
jgi:hypothetical protein